MNRSSLGVEAVLFDAVGTLIFPDPDAAEVYRRVGSEFGAKLSLDEITRRFRGAFRAAFADARSAATCHAAEQAKWRDVVERVFRGTGAPIEEVFPRLWEHFAQSRHWSIFPDGPACWQDLEARGYVLGIASNYDDRLTGVLHGLPPLDACRHVFWSSRVGYAKPHPRFFEVVANELQLPPGKILLVGDDWENDVLGARAAGWKTVFLDRKGAAIATDAVASLTELRSFLS